MRIVKKLNCVLQLARFSCQVYVKLQHMNANSLLYSTWLGDVGRLLEDGLGEVDERPLDVHVRLGGGLEGDE